MTHRSWLYTLAAALVASATAVACSDNPAGPDQLPQDELIFLRAAPDAPPLAALQMQVWAKVGEGRRVEIPYAKVGEYGGDKCLELNIPGDALLRRPDGTSFHQGDSILITVTVSNPAQFHFRFEPSGLRFNPKHPAELRISYKWADPDYNDDGVVDSRDTSRGFSVWRQEGGSDPWFRVDTDRDVDAQEARADVLGFTKYALAAD
jgi:hypothetical protein